MVDLSVCKRQSGVLPEGLFRDKDGITTVGVAVALLVTLALVFSSAQVYRINTASAEVQSVADASALAALNEVAEFTIVARVCDAVVLTLSLTGLVALGLGVAALCTPFTFELSSTLIQAGQKVLSARDSFADKAQAALDKLQRALPLLAAANALSVASANGQEDSSFTAVAILVPWEGTDIAIADDETDGVVDSVDENADAVKEKAQRAEDIAKQANEVKREAYEHDCGLNPSYCMYERAQSLAGMTGSENPYYGSIDAWSFSVALERAKAYYPTRLSQEAPQGSSVAEQARSVLRTYYYEYACARMDEAYVNESEDSFDANFPLLAKNTSEMRSTELYTQVRYPITQGEDGSIMHAWSGCPRAGGAVGNGSIAQMESGGFTKCPSCEFSAASMGKVAAASSSIDNGFEYHYRIVAEAAREYQKLRAELDPLSSEIKQTVSGLFDEIAEAIGRVADKRIEIQPPGNKGAIAVVFSGDTPLGFSSSFVNSPALIGTRAAVSAATLVEETAGEGGNVISSILSGLKDGGGALVGGAGIVLDCWAALLQAYSTGQEALTSALSSAIDAIPFASESGLGTWAAGALKDALEVLGLQPADLDAVKPVLVNSYHVASQGSDAVSSTLVGIKRQASTSTADAFSAIASGISGGAIKDVDLDGGTIEIASIDIVGGGSSATTLEISLPPAVARASRSIVEGAINGLRGVYAQITGVKPWT